MPRPNIILIMTDQQRYDTATMSPKNSSLSPNSGWPMLTPNLDRLSREGAVLTNAFCAAPSCVPSRYSFFNGCYPRRDGVFTNSHSWTHSWVENLREAGYICLNVGKMHTVPYTADCGFHQRFPVENKDRPLQHMRSRFFDEWDKFLFNNGLTKPSRYTYRDHYPDYESALGAYEWPLEECYHPDAFVGNLARWVISEYAQEDSQPLFLQIGFPGPHPPYDPPQRFIDMYRDAAILLPDVTEGEISGQPPCQHAFRREMIEGNHDGIRWMERPQPMQLLRLRRYYAANVTQIDEQIGMVLDSLGNKGLLDNALVVFTSDHGDCLGDHGHIEKWTMYDEIMRVPMILWSSGGAASGHFAPGTVYPGLVQQMDVADYILASAGVPRPNPQKWDARPLDFGDSVGRDFVLAEHARDNVWHGASFMRMVRTKDRKIVVYPGEEYGELYDLARDPRETVNLWNDADYKTVRGELFTMAMY